LTPKERAADLRFRRQFHITLSEYNRVLRHQGGACAICKKRPATGKPRLAVDHCHTTGLLRGLLCWHCNDALAAFSDNAEWLLAAVAYLLYPPFEVVFKKERFTAPGRIGTKKRAKLLKVFNPQQGVNG
jgi:hypothetical protein